MRARICFSHKKGQDKMIFGWCCCYFSVSSISIISLYLINVEKIHIINTFFVERKTDRENVHIYIYDALRRPVQQQQQQQQHAYLYKYKYVNARVFVLFACICMYVYLPASRLNACVCWHVTVQFFIYATTTAQFVHHFLYMYKRRIFWFFWSFRWFFYIYAKKN